MSALINDAAPFRWIQSASPRAQLYQRNSVRRIDVPQRGLRAWAARRRLRLALRDLADDKHLLADIGLTREEALDEAAKPFWR
ncbi:MULTISPECIES: DUF1127 domain-containing protein [Bradyrhizobium]|uniref:DUF1127 domain-containing protein n=1 Tax=Bradyrhizobium elkanii TaxID=29448 RepID=UPI0003F80050|nr:DUF1127 domain-containing protein [Bradyrhizobium elkanii]